MTDIVADVRQALAFLWDVPGFLGLYLTGSVILRIGKPQKDLDIVLRFADTKSAIAAGNLPEKIAGIKTDFFYYIGADADIFFACLDCEQKRLILSGWFPLKIDSIDPGIEIVQAKPSIFGESIKKLLLPSSDIKQEAKKGWAGVVNEWDRLTKFVAAARSRGIIATAKHAANLDSTDGIHVDQATYELRRNSCFGSEKQPPCSLLVTNASGHRFCGACGCGQTALSRLDGDKPEDYTKLHYPALHCPLKREGFTK